MTSTYEIYGKTGCEYCFKAIQYCNVKDVIYEYYQLNEDFTRDEMLEIFPMAKSYPQILHNGISIGGFTELVKEINKERL